MPDIQEGFHPKFRVGETVTLNSETRQMTVIGYSSPTIVSCEWRNKNDEQQIAYYPEDALKSSQSAFVVSVINVLWFTSQINSLVTIGRLINWLLQSKP